MFDYGALFAFCDLHASRWRQPLLTVEDWNDLATLDLVPRYFDRQGFPIPGDGERDPTLVWARMHSDLDYCRVAYDDLPDGSYLSTVWLGLDHGFGGPPLIFETMRFAGALSEAESPLSYQYHETLPFPDPIDDSETDQLRYRTEEEALAVHHEIVRRIRLREGH